MLDANLIFERAKERLKGHEVAIFPPEEVDSLITRFLREYIGNRTLGLSSIIDEIEDNYVRPAMKAVAVGQVFTVAAFLDQDRNWMNERQFKARRAILWAVLVASEQANVEASRKLEMLLPNFQKWLLKHDSEMKSSDDSTHVLLRSNGQIVTISPDDLRGAIEHLRDLEGRQR